MLTICVRFPVVEKVVMKAVLAVLVLCALTSIGWAQDNQPASAFPFMVPRAKPNRPLSEALARNYDAYEAIRPEQNELYLSLIHI